MKNIFIIIYVRCLYSARRLKVTIIVRTETEVKAMNAIRPIRQLDSTQIPPENGIFHRIMRRLNQKRLNLTLESNNLQQSRVF
jgi:hypothetical protein